MRKPQPPPNLMNLLTEKTKDSDFLARVLAGGYASEANRYMPWDELRWRPAPEGLTHEEWWLVSKIARNGMERALPLSDAEGRRFSYALPDEVLRGIEVVDKHLSGRIGVPRVVTEDAPGRARYVINSLIEEAIMSSQLEGVNTTHRVAKDMLRTGRKPRTRDERMILNNYQAMQRVGEIRREPLTPALIFEIHRIVTAGTLDDPSTEGRAQLPGESRVVVEDIYDGTVMHVPPPAEQLTERLQRLCDFANGSIDIGYVPPVVRAIVIHFMLGYDHPFVDGNGRTARVLFYWSLLNQDYWLAEFLPISRLLARAPGQYGRSFLHCEQDDGDLTYFVIYQLTIIQRAVTDLQEYLAGKVAETKRLEESLVALSRQFNYRQIALLQHAVKNPHARYTVVSHAGSHNVVAQTARMDLQGLEQQGLLTKVELKRGHAWTPVNGLTELLDPNPAAVGRHRRRRPRRTVPPFAGRT
ncbi:MAG TPA: Fic family protein [Streptosporangiaceae bacterium]|nr:Fic family protein [Streptosporangiaceae bacterium]